MEGIAVEQYRSTTDYLSNAEHDKKLLSVFHSMISDELNQDGAATAANTTRLLKALVQDDFLQRRLSTIWEETDGCAKSYRCATALFLLCSVAFTQDIIIDRMVGAPGNGKGVVDELNAVNKTYLHSYMSKISQPGVETSKKKMDAHDSTETASTSFADICVQLLGLSSRKEISEGTSKRGK